MRWAAAAFAGLGAGPPAPRPSVGDLRFYAEWVVQAVWVSREHQNQDTAFRMWGSDSDRLRRVAAHLRESFPWPWLLHPPKLYHGFRHANPRLKVMRPNEWTDARGVPSFYRSFSESSSTACNYAHDQTMIDAFLAARWEAGQRGGMDVEFDTETMAPRTPMPPPWGHGYVAVLGRNVPDEALLFHWRFFFEHPAITDELVEASLKPRLPKTLTTEMEYLGNSGHFEYVLDCARMPPANVVAYDPWCTKDRLFRVRGVREAHAYMNAAMARQFPGPSPAFPNPSVP